MAAWTVSRQRRSSMATTARGSDFDEPTRPVLTLVARCVFTLTPSFTFTLTSTLTFTLYDCQRDLADLGRAVRLHTTS